MARPANLSAEILGRITLLQSMVAQMPDRNSMLALVCRGFADVAGVHGVTFRMPDSGTRPQTDGGLSPKTVRVIPIKYNSEIFAELCFEIGDKEAFEPYLPFLENFSTMLAVIIEKHNQTKRNETLLAELEKRVTERTCALMNEVTERKQAVEALRESEYFFKESQHAANIGSYKADFVKGCWESSEVLNRIFGIDENHDRSIANWLEIVHPDDRENMNVYLRDEVISKHKPFSIEYRIIRKSDGEVRWVNGLGKLGFAPDGSVVSLIGTIQDITERKLTEEALQKTQKLESLGVLAGGIAHDFNNLLAMIFGNVETALRRSTDPRVTATLEKTMSAMDRARGLTAQLLTFAKGGAPVRKVGPLFPFVQETAQFALSGANVACRFDVPDDLWHSNHDRNQIGQVVDNIVINAQQAMPMGGTIDITARNLTLKDKEHPALKAGRFVRISMQDSGLGISKELLPRIFDPFFTTKAKGQGLGLATCYSIVNRHGGVIDVESEPGKGSTFHVWLPAGD